MDNKAILLEFKLLVDRATEILENLTSRDRIEAINYALASIKGKIPESREKIKLELVDIENPNAQKRNETYEENLWRNSNQQHQHQQQTTTKADLNQNFEKILCKEEFICPDDDKLQQPTSILKSENVLDNCDASLVITRYNDDWSKSNNNNNSSSTASITFQTTSNNNNNNVVAALQCLEPKGRVIREKLLISGPIHIKCDYNKKFEFVSNKFCIPFLRSEENFNRKAFRQQILSAIEFAVNHRKPFLKNFINLVLSGKFTDVRPKQIEGISDINEFTTSSPPSPTTSTTTTLNTTLNTTTTTTTTVTTSTITIDNNQNSNNNNNNNNNNTKNGIIKETSVDVDTLNCLAATEEVSQDTDSSVDDANSNKSKTTNSIAIETPKDKSEENTNNSRVVKGKQTYNCLRCPKTYRKRKSLIDHYKLHPGYCHDCGQPNGTTLEEIKEHNRVHHAHDFPFICEICGESFSRRQQFHIHVEAHNNNKEVKSYSCKECGMEFPRQKLHRKHQIETGHKPDGAICEVCGEGFNSKSALCQHMNRVHKKDNSFECHICQNKFSLKTNLERHVQLHTEVKRTYICDKCGSSYFTYPALKGHFANAHTDVSESKCTLCGKTFSSVKSLQRHQVTHSEERPYSCNFCLMSFKWKTHLVRHKQFVHAKQPAKKVVKRFAKTEDGGELVPVDVSPPPAKTARKSNNKPKSSVASNPPATTTTNSIVSNTKPTTPLETQPQNNFKFSPDHIMGQGSSRSTSADSTILMNINNFAPSSDNFRFENAAQNFKNAQMAAMQTDNPLMKYEATYQQQQQQQQQQKQQQQKQQQQQQSQQQAQQSHHPQTQPPQLHHLQQPQVQHHHHQTHHHPQQPQPPHSVHHLHQQQFHSPQHQTQHSHLQQQHLQAQQHLQQQHQHQHQHPHQAHPSQHPHPHAQHIPHAQPQQHAQHAQQHQQAQHITQHHAPQPAQHAPAPHPQQHHTQIQQTQHSQHPQQPQPQQQPQYSCSPITSNDWQQMTFTAAGAELNPTVDAKDSNKYYSVIEVNSNDFMGLPINDMKQEPVIDSDLLNFQNMWSNNNQQLSFTSENIEPNTYNNIGSILTNLELIGNNSNLDFNNFDMLGEHHAMTSQQMQQNPYLHQDLDPNSGAINHQVINYDYNSQNHTITDISNTILRDQDGKTNFPYQTSSSYEQQQQQPPQQQQQQQQQPPPGVYAKNEENKIVLPPLNDYMHQTMQQQQSVDVNIVYYPVKYDVE